MENKDLLQLLIDATLSGSQQWESTSGTCMFFTTFHACFYSIEKRYDLGHVECVFLEWDENGEVRSSLTSGLSQEINSLLDSLFKSVISSNKEYEKQVAAIMKDWEKVNNQKLKALGLDTIRESLTSGSGDGHTIYTIKQNDSFYYVTESQDNYIEPPFIQLATYEGYTPIEKANVLFVSAPGATGKSALTKYLSFSLKIPVFDLGRHKAVGAHSLVGLLVDFLEMGDYVTFKNGLVNNRQAMIIDGLDEGEIKVNKAAFDSFLDDVVNIAKDADGTPFLMLGRSRTVEDSIYYLESKGVSVACLQIEPFTMEKAIRFIDRSLSSNEAVAKYQKPYKEVQEYIINSIHGFFEDDEALESHAYNRFIGYAPVLMAISSLLTEREDYNKLLNELVHEKHSNIDLVINIIEKVLIREREKIRDGALPALLENYDDAFCNLVLETAAGLDEQCGRLLYYLLGRKYSFELTGDAQFDYNYRKQMERWIPNHPFLSVNEGKFQNIVFESYVIARLASNKDYVPMVLTYLGDSKSNSYLLFDFYNKLAGSSRNVDYRFLPYLFDSFRALDSSNEESAMEMISTTEGEDFLEARCELSFFRKGRELEIEFLSDVPYDSTITLPSSLYGITIDVPLKVSCQTSYLDIRPPVSVRCSNFTIESRDVVISSSKNILEDAVIECDHFKAVSVDGTIPTVVNRAGKSYFKIRTSDVIGYPFTDYGVPSIEKALDDKDLYERYNKLRRTIILFRSNGKENMARIQGKIQSRICNTSVGKAVVDKLLERKVLVPKGILYILNSKALDEQLGLSYDSIHSGELNEKTKSFLMSI